MIDIADLHVGQKVHYQPSHFDDWYDFKGGESRECPKCEKTMHVLDIEAVMYVRLGSEPE